jgi:hypothetical protein
LTAYPARSGTLDAPTRVMLRHALRPALLVTVHGDPYDVAVVHEGVLLLA